MSKSLAIAYSPWRPERVESFQRLTSTLNIQPNGLPHLFDAYRVFDEKAPLHVWTEAMWRWASEQDVEWCVFTQDDTVVAPGFGGILDTMLYRMGDEYDVVGLQVAHPQATALHALGYEAFTTTDGVIGVGYAIRRTALCDFLAWRSRLAPERQQGISEDTQIAVWCAITGRKVWHPLPTCIDHDTTLPSTYGNDNHPHRRSTVRWDTPAVPAWKEGCPHLGRFYEATPRLARECGADEETVRRIEVDTGTRVLRQLHYTRRADALQAPAAASVFIATPTRGGVSTEYAATVWRILRDEELDVSCSLEINDVQQWSADVVRVRSRFVRHFLQKTDATHILFLDSDIGMLPKVLRGMLAAARDFVGAPYPRRDAIDFTRVRRTATTDPEAPAYRYSVRLLDTFDPHSGLELDTTGCAEVAALPFGCILLTRACCQRMWDAYLELSFKDDHRGDCVALFDLMRSPEGGLLSEDFSFCARWRELGEKVWMYLGPGSPVDHEGAHLYRGSLEAFGLRRV